MFKVFLVFNRFLARVLCKIKQGRIIRNRDLFDV